MFLTCIILATIFGGNQSSTVNTYIVQYIIKMDQISSIRLGVRYIYALCVGLTLLHLGQPEFSYWLKWEQNAKHFTIQTKQVLSPFLSNLSVEDRFTEEICLKGSYTIHSLGSHTQ